MAQLEPCNTHDDLVPGTVHLVRQNHHHQPGHHTSSSKYDILLIPTPSSDLSDPLRWSKARKAYHLFLLFAYSSVMGAVTNWEAPIYLQLMTEYKTSISELNIGSAVLLLLLGVGNVFATPLSNKLGRRFIYNLSLLTVCISEIWMAISTNIGDFHGAHVLTGLGAAPFEALVAISISDVWFSHERGSKLGVYVFGLAFGSFMGPLCSGYMAINLGWRWIYRVGAIMSGVLFVCFYFTCEESLFIRRHPDGLEEDTRGHQVDETLSSSIGGSGDVEQRHHHHHHHHHHVKDKDSLKSAEMELQREVSLSGNVGEVFDTTSFTFQTRFYKLFPEPSWSEILSQMWRPLQITTLPAVVWCGINYGTCVSWLSILGTTTAMIFNAPPYGFTEEKLGLIWVSPMIGALIGAYFSGPLNDRFVLFLSRRNQGFREAEYRLWCCIPTAIILPAGLVIYGVTSARGLPWIVPIIGTSFVGFGLSVTGAVTVNYIMECYPLLDAHAVTTIILIRNIVGFGLTWGIQPWIDGMGQQNTFISIGALSFAITGFAGFFILFGKPLRRWTAARYLRLAQAG